MFIYRYTKCNYGYYRLQNPMIFASIIDMMIFSIVTFNLKNDNFQPFSIRYNVDNLISKCEKSIASCRKKHLQFYQSGVNTQEEVVNFQVFLYLEKSEKEENCAYYIVDFVIKKAANRKRNEESANVVPSHLML